MSSRRLLTLIAITLLFSSSVFAERAVRRGEATQQSDAKLDLIKPMALGDIREDLLYTPLDEPCRILDTRITATKIASGETRPFYVINASSEIEEQGGRAGGCNVPVGAAAVMINFVAVAPEGSGNLKAAAFGTPIPAQGSIINYSNLPGLNIANAVPMPICTPSCLFEFHVQVNGAAVHLVGDVLGYFKPHQSVFIHTATSGAGGNIQAHITYLDHPELNGIASAAVILTPYWDSSAATNPHLTGAFYDGSPERNRWAIFNLNAAAMVNGSKFQVLILKR